MSTNEENKSTSSKSGASDGDFSWFTKRFSVMYVPRQYQAWVATIVSGLLYFRAWSILFTPNDSSSGACGSLFRPTLDSDSDNMKTPVGWFWNILGDVTDAYCPRMMIGLYSEFIFVAFGLAVCGLVLRKSMKREQANT